MLDRHLSPKMAKKVQTTVSLTPSLVLRPTALAKSFLALAIIDNLRVVLVIMAFYIGDLTHVMCRYAGHVHPEKIYRRGTP